MNMKNLMSMTFHESYGNLPTRLLRTYRKANISPADHDQILTLWGARWSDTDIPWTEVETFVLASIDNDTNQFRMPRYL